MTYEPKEPIFPPGQYFEKSIYILSGMVRNSIINTQGRQSNFMQFEGAGMVVPCYCRPYRTTLEPLISVEAYTAVEALMFDISDFGDLVVKTPETVLDVVETQLRKQNSALVRMHQTSSYTSLQQVCNTLYMLGGSIGSAPHIMLAQEELGAVNGLSRVRVTRVLGKLRERAL